MTSQNPSFHALRRGRMWKWVNIIPPEQNKTASKKLTLPKIASMTATVDSPATDEAGNTVGSPEALSFAESGLPSLEDAVTAAEAAAYQKGLSENKYGFQFLWNPESLSINTDLNLNVTPNTADIFKTVGQAYPSMETMSIAIVLDRTNDFACFRGLRNRSLTSLDYDVSELTSGVQKFYSSNRFGKAPGSEAYELRQLLRLGTVYDIEYLYKTINSNPLVPNFLGRNTADNGFLTPNAIGFQLGPTMNSIAYLGWVSTVNVQHVAFTEDMIPIRSIVNLTFNVLTNGGM